jgi:hypothetical protein
MARDIYADIDRLSEQLGDLRTALVKQSKSTADDASHYLTPRARQAARLIQHESREVLDAARRHPGTTGALVGAFALGALAWAICASRRDAD